MHRDECRVHILMYHSISDGVGPTCIAPHLFRQQMTTLADCGYHAIALADFAAWARGERELAARSVVVTFDDGFDDFATAAFPELQDRGWTATVFLPAGKVGGVSDWAASMPAFPVRPLMTWKTVTELTRRGVEFGAHGVTHADLTALSPGVAQREIVHSKRLIEDNAGCRVTSFASPYGKTNRTVRLEISKHYQAAVGTTLAQARRTSDLYDLPRIEMWYFRSQHRWRAYLEEGSRGYFILRQALRTVRVLAHAD